MGEGAIRIQDRRDLSGLDGDGRVCVNSRNTYDLAKCNVSHCSQQPQRDSIISVTGHGELTQEYNTLQSIVLQPWLADGDNEGC